MADQPPTPKVKDDADLQYRGQLLSTTEKLCFEFDRKLTWLSSGAIVVSLLFVEKVVGEGPCKVPCFLMVAWLLFSAVLILALINNHIAIRAFTRRYQDHLAKKKFTKPVRKTIMQVINIINIILLGLGILFLTIFCLINHMSKGSHYGERVKSHTGTSAGTSTGTSTGTSAGSEPRSGD